MCLNKLYLALRNYNRHFHYFLTLYAKQVIKVIVGRLIAK